MANFEFMWGAKKERKKKKKEKEKRKKRKEKRRIQQLSQYIFRYTLDC